MKTTEQALAEWTTDEIKFDAGPGPKQMFTSAEFIELVAAMKDNRHTGRSNVGVNWEEADVVAKFAFNSGRELSPQWLMQFESMTEARKHLMESWEFDPLR